MDRRRLLQLTSAAIAGRGLRSWALGPRPTFVDAHVHVWKRDPAFPFAEGARVPEGDASAESLIARMHANGVGRTVIIQVIHYRWDNSYLADVLRRYPRLFRGVCRVNPEHPAAPDQLSRLTEQGFRGVRLSPAAGAQGDWIRGPLMPPLWRRCNELRVPMTLLIPVSRLPDLVPLIERNPELTVVIDHMADCPVDRPDQLELLLDLARYPRVFVKISHMWSLSKQPYPYPDAAQQVRRVWERFGAERLMAGTDWPIAPELVGYPERVALYRDHLSFLPAHDRKQIVSGTALRVWPF
jgi:predicted TIM-barrel fold metal-dependent hydrolase